MAWNSGPAILRHRQRRVAAFAYGAAHAFDFTGVLAKHHGRFGRGFLGDAKALRRDWEHVIRSDQLPPLHSSYFSDGEA